MRTELIVVKLLKEFKMRILTLTLFHLHLNAFLKRLKRISHEFNR